MTDRTDMIWALLQRMDGKLDAVGDRVDHLEQRILSIELDAPSAYAKRHPWLGQVVHWAVLLALALVVCTLNRKDLLALIQLG